MDANGNIVPMNKALRKALGIDTEEDPVPIPDEQLEEVAEMSKEDRMRWREDQLAEARRVREELTKTRARLRKARENRG